ncbi:MAG: hypothetical protein JXA89_21200 [Anaerolineae bacterium]|nr:hypothetical protein [Anaerolineae bacterium]
MTILPSVQIEQLPKSVQDFVALRDQIAQSPQGGAAMMVLAILAYTEDRTLGWQCLTVAVDRERLQEGSKGYKGWQLSNGDLQRIQLQVQDKPYLPKSYIEGATPENGYALSGPPYVIACSDNPYSGDLESGTYKVFVACSGASSPRPITLKRNDKGFWKASEWSSLLVGVKAPAQTIHDDL